MRDEGPVSFRLFFHSSFFWLYGLGIYRAYASDTAISKALFRFFVFFRFEFIRLLLLYKEISSLIYNGNMITHLLRRDNAYYSRLHPESSRLYSTGPWENGGLID